MNLEVFNSTVYDTVHSAVTAGALHHICEILDTQSDTPVEMLNNDDEHNNVEWKVRLESANNAFSAMGRDGDMVPVLTDDDEQPVFIMDDKGVWVTVEACDELEPVLKTFEVTVYTSFHKANTFKVEATDQNSAENHAVETLAVNHDWSQHTINSCDYDL